MLTPEERQRVEEEERKRIAEEQYRPEVRAKLQGDNAAPTYGKSWPTRGPEPDGIGFGHATIGMVQMAAPWSCSKTTPLSL